MSTFITILSGVTVFVAGQIIVKLIIDPIQAYKSTVGEIAMSLIKNANVYSNPGVCSGEKNNVAQDEFRFLGSKLSSQISLIPKYDLTAKIFFLPKKEDIHEVKSQLIGLSNSLHTRGNNIGNISPGEFNSRRAEKISDLLGIYIPEGSRVYRPENVS